MKIMKPLPKILRKNGFTYTQVCRGVKSFIYSQTVSVHVVYYEVFMLKTAPAQNFKGKFIEERERFPHNEAFGHWAWAFLSYEDAMERFNELEAGK